MSHPKITVLTAVRNGALYVAETIASIQQQDFRDWEYIFVDDASEDETVRIIESAMRGDPRIRLLQRRVSAGPYTAANDGLRESRGDYIVRTDADDLSPAHRLTRQLAFMEEHPECRACVSYWQGFDIRGLIPGLVATVPLSCRVFCWHLLLRSASIHSAACMERAALLELGGYRELPLSQDYRLWCELTRRRWLGVIPEILSYVRQHPGRASHQRTGLQRELAMDVLSDHLFALTGERWSKEDLETLWAVGYSHPLPAGKGLAMLDRWDRMWQADPDLSKQDREELERLSHFRRWKHLRANAHAQPGRVLLDAFKLTLTKPGSIRQAQRAIF